MKKISFVFVTMMTVLLSGILMACSLKDAEANFSQEELVLSIGQTLDLDDYLTVKGIEKNEVSYLFSDSSIFKEENDSLKANKAGKSIVYATYKNNSLASMRLVVKKQFSAPTNFSVSESGLVSWGVVSDYFEDDANATVAASYTVTGTYVPMDEDGNYLDEIQVNEVVDTNSYQIDSNKKGKYILAVVANATGYFDKSELSNTQTFYIGGMETPEVSTMSFTSDGVFSWGAIAGAKYKIKLDSKILVGDYIETTSKDISSFLENASYGTHSLSVVVYDKTGDKIASVSDSLQIKKLQVPSVQYSLTFEGGYISLSNLSDVEAVSVIYKKVGTEDVKTFDVEVSGSVASTFMDEIAVAGAYEVAFVSKTTQNNMFSSSLSKVYNIYKLPEVEIIGSGSNLENGTIFNAIATTSQSAVATNFVLDNADDLQTIQGFDEAELSKNIEIELSEAGVYNFSVRQDPQSSQNTVDEFGTQKVYVLSSKTSTIQTITKLEKAENVEHSYVGNKSVFAFDTVENATKYFLLNEGDVIAQSNETEIMLEGKVDDLFDVYEFSILAKTDDDLYAINSVSDTKNLTVLSAPTTAGSGNSTNKTYTWNPSAHADGYVLYIYALPSEDVDLTGITPQIEETTINQYVFESEGYYHVKIFAISNDENNYLNAKECFEESFYISEQIELSEVNLGFGEELVGQNSSLATGYFIRIENVENADYYEVSIDDSEVVKFDADKTQTYTYYNLTQGFSTEQSTIKITAGSNNSVIYLSSDEKQIKVQKLEDVTLQNIGDQVYVDDLTERVYFDIPEGASEAVIAKDDNNKSTWDDVTGENVETISLSIKNWTNFDLSFVVKGTKIEDTIYQGDNIYLDANQTTIHFERETTPTNFEYYENKLTFEFEGALSSYSYVLDLICESGSNKYNISLKFAQISATASCTEIGLKNQTLDKASNSYRSITEGKYVTFDLDALLETVNNIPVLASVYANASKIEFAAYVYKNEADVENGVYLLSSLYATCKADSTKTSLSIEKMPSPVLEFAEQTATDYVLKWSAVDVDNDEINALTTYEVYSTENDTKVDGTLTTTAQGILTFTFSKTGLDVSKYYSFYIVAKNPYYLESNSSNIIKIYQLNTLQRLKISKDGTFELLIDSKDSSHVEKVLINNVECTTFNNIPASIGDLKIKIVGKTETNADVVTHYIDSEETTWTIEDFESLAPNDLTLSYDDNGNLSWAKYAESTGLSSLKYRIIFKDEDEKSVFFDTTENTINVLSGLVYQTISVGLSAGDIEVQVVAYLDTYSVAPETTAYYRDKQILINDAEIYNAKAYTQKTIIKLKTPEVENVEIESEDFSEQVYPTFAEKSISIDLESPNLTVTSVGNYGDAPTVMAFINENETPVFSGTVSVSENKYSFDISSANYEFDSETDSMTIKIKVQVAGAIPSSLGSVVVKKASDISEVEFVKDSDIVSNKVEIAVDDLAVTVGGIVIKIDYIPNNGETKTQYAIANVTSGNKLEIDLSEFIEANLSMGGTIKVEALINSYSSNGTYILPSSFVATEEIEVLKAVEETEVTIEEGGIVISTQNGTSCTYILKANGNTYEVEYKNGEFYFEFPNDWADGSYTLTIFAQEANKMSSVASDIDIEISRIAQVDKDSITMQRTDSDLSQISISWDAVEDAGGYLVKVYDKANSSLILEKTLTPTSQDSETYLLKDILGENYSDVEAAKGTAFLIEDQNLLFEIVVLPNGSQNNSYKTTVDVLLKGNILISQDSSLSETIVVDEFGRLSLDLENGEYLYKLDTSSYTADPWKELSANGEAVLVDLTEFSKVANEGYLTIRIAKLGALEKQNKSFEIDSYSLSSSDSYKFNNSIVSLGYHISFNSSLTLEILKEGFSKIYVGETEDALLNGNVAEVSFSPSLVAGTIATNLVYETSFANFLDDLIAGGIKLPTEDKEIKLYFWAYQEANENIEFLASKPQELVFDYEAETTFVGIDKLGETEDAHDYANVYAVFENGDTDSIKTLGIFVRITAGEEVVTKFVSLSELEDDSFDSELVEQDEYKINLSKIFEQDDLINATGDVKVEFARLQVENNNKLQITMWTEETSASKELTFTRLAEVKNVRLSGGNLYWEGIAGGKYYVYLVKVNDDIRGTNVDPITLTDDFVFNPVVVESYDSSGYSLEMAINENATYYIAVQAYSGDSENNFILPSKRVYIKEQSETTSTLTEIYKNQVSSSLVVKDGQIFINWTEQSEIYKILSAQNPSAEQLLSTVPFANPFTFTIGELLADNVMFRLVFTSKDNSTTKTYDINAKDLLANLFGASADVDFEKKLSDLYANTTAGSAQTMIREFITYCRNASYGIANTRKIFDDIFETLQIGNYSLKYCLLGNDTSVSSNWYSFANEYGENVIYVNGQPDSRIVKNSSETDVTFNEYKLIIKKAELYQYVSENVYETIQAENYVIKLLNTAGDSKIFDIIKNESSYSLTLKDSKIEGSVSVYESDVNGNVLEGGDYLMIYINQNNGDSILGLYTHEIEKATYNMQIYAVGNDVTFSSKSKYHALTFLGFSDNVSVNNGAFVWATQTLSTRKTTVVYKSSTALEAETVDIGVSEDGFYSRYSLTDKNGNDLGEGLYDYVKFIRVGEVRTNSTFIDSEIYQFKNIYKLSGPSKLANDYGYLSIKISESDYGYLKASYSDTNIFNYRIYHDAISYSELNNSSYIAVADERTDSEKGLTPFLYQAGASSVDSSFDKYNFKVAEKDATNYYVASMGSTISSSSIEYIEGETESYNLRTFYLVDENGDFITDEEGTIEEFAIAIRSTFSKISAQMLADVGDLSIENGLLLWNEVKSSNNQELSIDSPVYKITAVLYEESAVGQNPSGEILTTQTNTIIEKSYYTAETSFDFTKIEQDLKDFTTQNTLIKVSVQALALELCEEVEDQTNYVSLIEGGYAYGNVVYKEQTGTYVLMSNASTLSGIKRYAPIVSGSLDVVDGRITFNFVAQSGLTESAFKNLYNFEIVQKIDGVQNIITGDFNILNESNGTYTIQFVEEKGSFVAGVCSIVVYVTQGRVADGYVIKSFATELENVEKLETVQSKDYVITSETDSETLDFSEFFANNAKVKIIASVEINSAKQNDITFTSSKTKLLILNAVPTQSVELEDDYIGYLTITDSQVVKLIFQVVPDQSGDIVYSDLSEEFVLQRSSWGDEKQIVWNEQTQEFSWDYSLNTFNSQTSAQLIKAIYQAKTDAIIYQEEELITQSGNLTAGQKLFEVEVGEQVSKIKIDNVEHYTLTENLQITYLNSAVVLQDSTLYSDEFLTEVAKTEDEEDLIISADTEVMILQVSANSTQICYQNKLYYISTDMIELSLKTLSNGDLFEIVSETTTEAIIKFENEYYSVDASNIVRPIYIVEATYGKQESITRLYETTEKTFKPTIIGDVSIGVRIKLGDTNVQSQELKYDGFVDYNIFSSGEGTSSSPYIINSSEEFSNIAYRLQKEDYLKSYIQVGLEETVASEDKYYFELNQNISLTFDGILFKGTFEGVLNGKGFNVEYVATKTTELSSEIIVNKGQIGPVANQAYISFARGAALFETVDKNAQISNLNISATYGTVNVLVPSNALISGLAIKNSGNIENVNLISFKNNFYGRAVTTEAKNVLAFSGIAGVNSGLAANIKECSILTNIEVSDNATVQHIFVGGISYINTDNATISNCVAGQANFNADATDSRIVVSYSQTYGYVQIAGITVTCYGANLRGNTNNMDIAFVGPQTSASNYLKVYTAGITCYRAGTGTIENNVNGDHVDFTASNYAEGEWTHNDLIIEA